MAKVVIMETLAIESLASVRNRRPPRAAPAEVERTAWFDLNGDGRVINASPMHGGDGYLVGDGNGDGRVERGSIVSSEPVRQRTLTPADLPQDLALAKAVKEYSKYG